jgi:probable selenate reductase FAD-binding subunit
MVMEILRPTSIHEAERAGSQPGAAYLGGGTWLGSGKAARPLALISLEGLGLGSIRCAEAQCTIGATATFQQVLDGPPGIPPALRDAVSRTASRTLRNMATIGGEIGLASPSSVLVPVLIALHALVRLAGRKAIDVEQYCSERPAGLILDTSIPDSALPCGVQSLSRTSHSAKGLVVAISAGATSPALRGLRVVVSDCRGQLLRLTGIEKALEGAALPSRDRLEAMVRGAFSPAADMHASAAYKSYMAGVFAADLLRALAGTGAPA